MYKLAVYGTLKAERGNHFYYLKEARTVGQRDYWLKGYRLYDIGVPVAIPDTQGAILIQLYQVDNITLRKIDRLEGYVSKNNPMNMYERVEVQIEDHRAFMYCMLSLPDRGSYREIKDGVY